MYKILSLTKKQFLDLIPTNTPNPTQYIKTGGLVEKVYKLKHCGIIDCLNTDCTICRVSRSTWAKKIKERDHFICQNCQAKENLIAHHLLQRINFPEKAFDLSNGITLCRTCHIRAHRPRKSNE